jgi:hypothetical protein
MSPTPPDDFLSGTSGEVWGVRATSRAIVRDAICEGLALARLEPWRLRRQARDWPRRRVLALGVERTEVPNVMDRARAELLRSRHDVRVAITEAAGRGKFENLNALLAENPTDDYDWLLIVDDDVLLPGGFLDAFVFLAERFDFALAQPAHRWRSHAGWQITRRRPGVVARETRFVEIGPVCALRASTFGELLPFPPLRFGWGLDAHWSAVGATRGWRLGVIDATPMLHGLRRIAASYDRTDAIAEARGFLSDQPYTPAVEAQRTLAAHRSWR